MSAPEPTNTISIITINYNNARGLQKTLDSVRNLNRKPFEYIVIDGGSSDGSVELIAKNADIITVHVSEKDGGIYDALNKGIQKARGSLIGLIHSGDTYLPTALDKIPALHAAQPAAVLYGALKAVKNGAFESIWGYTADVLPRQMIPHLASFVPKAVYGAHGAYDTAYKIAADYDCFLRFYRSGVPFVFTDTIVCAFDLDGVSQRNDADTEREVIAIKKAHGVYVPPTKKQRFKAFVKRFFRF